MAPELSVTFSQPMIALTSQDDAAKTVPVKLNPQPPGKWRWVGTKTLLFQPEVRFPMATTYVVTVPAGTRAANGNILANEKSWAFTTPPLTVKTSYPTAGSTQPRDALMFMEFDQRIDPGAVLRALRVSAGSRILNTRLATDEEVKQAIARDPNVKAALSQVVSDQWMAFRVPRRRDNSSSRRPKPRRCITPKPSAGARPIECESSEPRITRIESGSNPFNPRPITCRIRGLVVNNLP